MEDGAGVASLITGAAKFRSWSNGAHICLNEFKCSIHGNPGDRGLIHAARDFDASWNDAECFYHTAGSDCRCAVSGIRDPQLDGAERHHRRHLCPTCCPGEFSPFCDGQFNDWESDRNRGCRVESLAGRLLRLHGVCRVVWTCALYPSKEGLSVSRAMFPENRNDSAKLGPPR